MNPETRFQTLYENTKLALYGYLYRVIGDAASAQDLFQESYLRLLGTNWIQLDDNAARAYLFRIASNLLKDRFRKQKREQAWTDEVLYTEQNSQPVMSDIQSPTAALEQLTPQNRSLLWLAYVEEYDHKQIAQMLGLRKGSVRVLLFRAKQKMIALLNKGNAAPETKP